MSHQEQPGPLHCLTCTQEVPGAQQLRSFVQQHLRPQDDQYWEWSENLKLLLNYLEAVLYCLEDAHVHGKDIELSLRSLSRLLTLEAQHQHELLYAAADIWQQRAKMSSRKEA